MINTQYLQSTKEFLDKRKCDMIKKKAKQIAIGKDKKAPKLPLNKIFYTKKQGIK